MPVLVRIEFKGCYESFSMLNQTCSPTQIFKQNPGYNIVEKERRNLHIAVIKEETEDLNIILLRLPCQRSM